MTESNWIPTSIYCHPFNGVGLEIEGHYSVADGQITVGSPDGRMTQTEIGEFAGAEGSLAAYLLLELVGSGGPLALLISEVSKPSSAQRS